MDNPIIIIVLAVVVIAFLLVVRKKQAEKKVAEESSPKSAKNGKKARESVRASKAVASEDDEIEEEVVDAAAFASFEEDETWTPAPVSVSVQQVDAQTEYQVYKEFGYLDKAAEALAAYLKVLPFQSKEQILELLSLWLEVGNIEKFTEELIYFKASFTEDDLKLLVREGLSVESNNLSLRVFADEALGWDVDAINSEMGTQDGLDKIQAIPQSEEVVVASNTVANGDAAVVDNTAYPLVKGRQAIEDLNSSEIMVIEAFSTPAKSARLLTGYLDYRSLVGRYNLAVETTEKPASILIDALKVDYQHHHIDNFAQHLWKLHQVLGRYGQTVKERMLGWGYTLGNHRSFADLARVTNEQGLKNMGVAYGFIPTTDDNTDSRFLLVEKAQTQTHRSLDRSHAADDVNGILAEAEAELMYGELDGAMSTLENGILNVKDEPQLYMMLFDLYEKAEAWSKFDAFSQQVRREVRELPEEVLLRMSHLSQVSAMKKVIS